jgi:hypothetical protein
MSFTLYDPPRQRPLAVPDEPEPLQLRLGRPGPEALWLPLADTTPLLLTGADLGAHRTLRALLGDWVQFLSATGEVDVVAWSELDIFLDSFGRTGVSVTPSLRAWLQSLRLARSAGAERPTVYVGYEVTGSAGDELLAALTGPEMEGPGTHLIWAAPPESAGGHLASDLPWRTRLEVEPDARHVVLSSAGQPPKRLLATWDEN